ncbi:putative histidinol dehydrogenase [Helianthus annuus]|uniref:Histidinol dehydrogenase n=1 Tax=Helianthus annuus TaxID=4232 RepID=A0A9K3DGN2_HELAN|nr:putative histidinol dehydrogenase [Helianthus annuus]KAJ0812726.1 putative histidinol dehydrogenase [Helianthus annuus]
MKLAQLKTFSPFFSPYPNFITSYAASSSRLQQISRYISLLRRSSSGGAALLRLLLPPSSPRCLNISHITAPFSSASYYSTLGEDLYELLSNTVTCAMKSYKLSDLTHREVESLKARPRIDFTSIFSVVQPIVDDVRVRGDNAVKEFVLLFFLLFFLYPS